MISENLLLLVKIANWQYFISRFWPVLLFKGTDLYKKSIALHLVNGRLRLQGEEAIYSYDDFYFAFQKIFPLVQMPTGDGLKALILGYGMGSIPFILEKKLDRSYVYTGIELDPVVVSLAQKYANPRLKSPVNLMSIDAQKFLHSNSQKFNLVCVDIFVGGFVPAFAKNRVFLKQLAESLNPKNSLLLFNYMKGDVADFEAFHSAFLLVFPQGRCIDLETNFVLIVES